MFTFDFITLTKTPTLDSVQGGQSSIKYILTTEKDLYFMNSGRILSGPYKKVTLAGQIRLMGNTGDDLR